MKEEQTEQTTIGKAEKTEQSVPRVIEETRARGRRRGKYIAVALLLLVLSLGAGAGGAWLMTRGITTSTVLTSSGTDGNKIVTQQEQDIASVASKVSPSVVSVVTKGEVQSYFGGTQTQEGAGTGIIISSNGYVMTNRHVVSGTSSVTVVTSDGATHSGVKVVGTDPLNDVAFLKIPDVSNLKAADLGDSTSIRIGQSVVAIGNALGQYSNTVTSGIISGTGRSVTASLDESDSSSSNTETLTDLLQTDAAINPGNSGGPLVNLSGQVIGMNTAIASDANNLGFSIPISATKGMIKNLLATGKVERAYLGVKYVSITADAADTYKLSARQGAYVHTDDGSSAVVSGGPADKAGVKDGDIITKVGDVEVGDSGSVSTLIGAYAPGDTVQLTVLRNGATTTLTVTLVAYQSS